MAKPQYRTREYLAEKERLRPIVAAGHAFCTEPICLHPNRWIRPGTPWDLAHATPTTYRGPAHADCNRSEGGRRGHAASCRNPRHQHRIPSRRWAL
jgi:hypothetical protein